MNDKARPTRKAVKQGMQDAIERTDKKDRGKPPPRNPSQSEAQREPYPTPEDTGRD